MTAVVTRANLPEILAPILSRAGQLVAAFAAIKLATTLLSPAEVGSINQLNSLAALLATGLVLPVIAYFARGVVSWIRAGCFEPRVHIMLLFIGLAALMLTAAGSLLQWRWEVVHNFSVLWVSFLLLAYLVGFPTHNLLINCTAVLGERRQTAVYSNLAAWLGLLAAVALYFQFRTPEAWFLGICIGFLASGLSFWFFLGKSRSINVVGSDSVTSVLPFETTAILRFAWPQVVVGVLWWIQSQSYRFQLAEISDVATVGLFFAGYALCSVPMQAFESVVNEYYIPMLYGKVDASSDQGIVQTWNLYASVFIPSILVFGGLVAACAPFLVIVALGREFQAVGSVIIWAALGETARALATVNHALGVAKVDMRRLLPPALAGALIAPALVQTIAPSMPLLGTAIALCLANVFVLVVALALVRLSAPVIWPWKRGFAAIMFGVALVSASHYAFDILPRTTGVALAVCAILGLIVLTVLYYISRSSLAAVTARP